MSAQHAYIAPGEVPARTSEAVRAALQQHRPDLAAEFDAALSGAESAERRAWLVRQWWGMAVSVLHPDPEAEQAHARLRAGDESHIVPSPF